MAHSLGTKVIHDVLQTLYTGEEELNPCVARPQALIQIANVSRLLQTDYDPYSSAVRPGRNCWQGVCDRFVNISHKLDPFLIPKPFEVRDFIGLSPYATTYLVKEVEIHRVTQLNVHDLTHYFKNPFVYESVFKALCSENDVTGPEHDAAMAEFKKDTLDGGLEEIIDLLEELDIKSVDSWKALLTAFKDYIERTEILKLKEVIQ